MEVTCKSKIDSLLFVHIIKKPRKANARVLVFSMRQSRLSFFFVSNLRLCPTIFLTIQLYKKYKRYRNLLNIYIDAEQYISTRLTLNLNELLH